MPEGVGGSLALNATSKSFSLAIGGMLYSSKWALNLKPWPSASSFKCLAISLNWLSHECKVDTKVSTELKLMFLKLMSTNGTCAAFNSSANFIKIKLLPELTAIYFMYNNQLSRKK